MKIYVVSLPDDHARRERLASLFPLRFADFEIVPAVDGRKSSPFLDTPQCKHNRHRPLTNTEIACARSHLNVYERIVNDSPQRQGFVLILEDDVQGDSAQLDDIEKFMPSLPRKSIVILGGLQGLPRAKQLYGYPVVGTGLYKIPRFQLRNIARTCCYLLDCDAAESLLMRQRTCITRADDWASLVDKDTHLFFCSMMSHPDISEAGSHIESSREILYSDGLMGRWRRDGIRESLVRPAVRIITPLIARAMGLRRVSE